MKILKNIQRVPGGIMVVPMIIGAAVNTFTPQFLKLGSFTTALFSSAGVATLIGATLFFIGTQMRLREAPVALKRGSVLLLAKFITGAVFAIFVAKTFGLAGIFGISSLALLSSMTNSNGGLYMALVGNYGDPPDMAAQSVLNLNDGPFLTLIVLGASGLANVPIMSLVAAVVPFIFGIILGNLDEDIRELMKPGVSVILPLVGFSLGATINFLGILKGGPAGLLLALFVLVISGIPAILADRFINKRPGYAGAATSSAAGNSIATPAAVAMIDPSYIPYVESATSQIAAAVIITAILVPLLTAYIAKRYGCPAFSSIKNDPKCQV
ncbi:2-keto-3-deoxygluconate permease [Gammaproteobacteria bacterium]|nr:2-keto-3-deoxygluconate permease [Gammaproteobacteria bacterium]